MANWIGYHYTTREIYDSVIIKKGLTLSPIHPRHHEEFTSVMEYLQDGAIWLYRLPQIDRALIGMLIYIAIEHGSKRVCLLEVEYGEDEGASILASHDLSDEHIVLQHKLTLGPGEYFGHQREPIELLIKPVPTERIKLIDEWDLEDLIRRR